MSAETVSIVIPCFNEAESLPALGSRLPAVLDLLCRRYADVRVLLVDDGSTDATPLMLQKLAAQEPRYTVMTHHKNQGLGAALRTGFSHSRSDVVITTDADGTYDFGEILGLAALLTPGVDIVTASPYHPAGCIEGVPAYRLALSLGASLCYRLLLDFNLHTYTAMFRAYRRTVLDTIQFSSTDYLSMTEILVSALLHGYSIAEFPVTLNVRKYGQSKARIARILRDHFLFQLRLFPAALRWKIRK